MRNNINSSNNKYLNDYYLNILYYLKKLKINELTSLLLFVNLVYMQIVVLIYNQTKLQTWCGDHYIGKLKKYIFVVNFQTVNGNVG
jgi:hypothetical protein